MQAFDPLCEVQSDKASVEITSPFDGVVKELLVKEGEIAKVGSGLCIIEVEEEVTEDSEPAPAPVEPTAPLSVETNSISSSIDTPSPGGASATRRVHPMDPNLAVEQKLSNVFAAPSIRHFARQQGVDLALLVPGSGKKGRIEKGDVESFLNGQRVAGAQGVPPTTSEPVGDVVVELGRTRYGMWKAMVKVCELQNYGSVLSVLTDLNIC